MQPETRPIRQLRERTVTVLVGICPAPGCGDEFHPRRENQVYCSTACRKAACVERQRERHGNA